MTDILQKILYLDEDNIHKKPLSVKLETGSEKQEIDVRYRLSEDDKKKIIEEAKKSSKTKAAVLKNKKVKIKTSWRCIYDNRGTFKHGIVYVLVDPTETELERLKLITVNSSSKSINKAINEVYCYYNVKEIKKEQI